MKALCSNYGGGMYVGTMRENGRDRKNKERGKKKKQFSRVKTQHSRSNICFFPGPNNNNNNINTNSSPPIPKIVILIVLVTPRFCSPRNFLYFYELDDPEKRATLYELDRPRNEYFYELDRSRKEYFNELDRYRPSIFLRIRPTPTQTIYISTNQTDPDTDYLYFYELDRSRNDYFSQFPLFPTLQSASVFLSKKMYQRLRGLGAFFRCMWASILAAGSQ